MPKDKPVTTRENLDVYVNRRTKEILEQGGYRLQDFDAQEKLIAVLQAEREYACLSKQ